MSRAAPGMMVGVDCRRHSVPSTFSRGPGAKAGTASGGTGSMLDERAVVHPEIQSGDRDDHSMQLIEYALAIIALAAAVLLAVVR